MEVSECAREIENRTIMECRHLSLRELQSVMLQRHGVHVTKKSLSLGSCELGISRRGRNLLPSRSELKKLIQTILTTTPKSVGYRAIWLTLKMDYRINVRRYDVMEIMREISPLNVQLRTSRSIKRREYSSLGPNYVWHVDGYDKLKKYGFAIHGCIDGYSRKLIWLEVGPTNNDPKVIGKYFLDSITKLRGVPSKIRADKGTEHIVIEQLQTSIRSRHHDTSSQSSFLYGKSCLNQRIERFWGSLRDGSMQYLMTLFAEMEANAVFRTADPAHIEALRFCFMKVVRRMLNSFSNHWDNHTVRRSFRNAVSGKPIILYNSETSYLHPVDDAPLTAAKQYVRAVPDVNAHFCDAAEEILRKFPDYDDTAPIKDVIEQSSRNLKYLVEQIDLFS